jgi:Zn-dependent protease with chaperone function
MSEAAFDGIYNDGRQAGAEPVRVLIKADGLLIETLRGSDLAFWPFDEIERHPDDEEGRIRLGSAKGGDARLAVSAAGFAAELRAKAPHLFRKGGVGSTLRLALLLGLLSAGVIGGIYLGIPRAAETVAPLIPPSVETRIGASYIRSVKQLWPACAQDGRARQALQDLTNRLLDKTKIPFAVSVDVTDMKIENAFALPGGHILFTRMIIARMESPDELAGVLAHELGHVVERHAMIGVIQQTGMAVLLQVLTGGSSGSSEWALNAAGSLATLSYTRRLEARADAHGLEMLKQAGINPRGIADLFERLEKERAGKTGLGLPPFLSSHPPTQARIALARAAADAPGKPALSPEDWAAVKALCAPKTTEPAPQDDTKEKPPKPAR